MNQIIIGQYSVVRGEKAILKARVTGNAIVTVAPTPPILQSPLNTFSCVVGNQNLVINILVAFPDQTPNSRVDLTIQGEIKGQPSGGPFPIATITRDSPVKSPQILLVVN